MQKNFEQFLENIKLTKKQRKDARKKANKACKRLYKEYYEGDYNDSKRLYVGSYGKHTNIRPVNDVDVVFVMPEDEFKRYDNQKKGQSQLLQDIREILSKAYSTSEKPKARGVVVVIETTAWLHNVELIPVFEQGDKKFLIPDTSDGGKWIKAGYREEKNNIKDSNKKSNGYTIKLIRILKKWISNRNINLKSFHIELLVVKFIEENELSDTYPYILKDFFEFLINMKNNNLIMPGTNEIIPLGDFWFGKTEIDLGRIKKAIDYESNQKNKSAYKEWNKLFGDDFPLLGVKNEELSDSEKCEIKKLTKLYPTPDEEFITDQFTVELNDDYQFEIDAKVNMPGFLRGYLSDFLKRGLLKLEREKEIKFEIKTNTVPLPYIIKWKVRNFGDQARKTSQLRGKILDDGGEEIRTEITRYTGTHYVECFVIKDNICVAKSIIFVPIE